MLQKLSIENYILIHELEVEFQAGFSVITGETGSGKSIFLGALGLILGQRADTGVLLNKSKKCVVEGAFLIKEYNLETFFQEHELDFDESAILRREISQTGKSRAFINDTPVNLSVLKELGDKLVNIHSQHSIITLNDADFQLAVLDNYAGIQPALQTYRSQFLRLSRLKKQKDELQEKIIRSKEEHDYFAFLYNELLNANLQTDEQIRAEERLQILTHAEEIKTALRKSIDLISGSDGNITEQLLGVINNLQSISRYNPSLKELIDRLNVNVIDIKDISLTLSSLDEHIEIDQDEIEALTGRLDILYRLLHKHQKSSIHELLSLQLELEKKILSADNMSEQVNTYNAEIKELERILYQKAHEISDARHKVIGNFEKEIVGLLIVLGMNQARFQIECTSSGLLTLDGIDKVRFLFSSNKGLEINEVSKIASGGELSRLMLSIKSMISQKNLLPTIFFDEIDSGVSGEIAGKVGTILKQMGARMQVIAITHIPQIAAKCNQHFWIYKNEYQDITTTYIKQLSKKEQIEEIAKMLSDNLVSPSAISNAKALLNN